MLLKTVAWHRMYSSIVWSLHNHIIQLANRTVPHKHTERHQTQNNEAINSQTSELSVSEEKKMDSVP